MGLTSYFAMGIMLIILTMALLIVKTTRKGMEKKPYVFSWLALFLIILNWTLYLTGFYASIPGRIGDLIFMPIWFLISIGGLLVALKEGKNNRTFAIINAGLSLITFAFGALIFLIGSM